jgi:ankyrin repeat protein
MRSVFLGSFLVISTALVSAASLSNAISTDPDEAIAMIKAGADVNAFSDGDLPLFQSAYYQPDNRVLKALIDAGANVNATQDEGGETAIMKACLAKNWEAVTLLARAGANLNAVSVNGSVLSFAVESAESAGVITSLVKSGAKVNLKDQNGRTALFSAAARWDQPTLVSALISAGAKADVTDNEGNTVLFRVGGTEILSVLVKAGAKINATNQKKQTALMMACQRATDPAIIEQFLRLGANAALEDSTGRTALDYLDQNKRLKDKPIRKTLKDAMKK